MNKLLFLIFTLQINILCFSGENKSLLFHYKIKEINETNENCLNNPTLDYNVQTKTICSCLSITFSLCYSKSTQALALLAYYSARKDIRKIDWNILKKNSSERLERYYIDIFRFDTLQSNIQQKKFDKFSFVQEEDGQPKYILRTFAIPLNYFLSQPYLFKFTIKRCSIIKPTSEIFSCHHVVELMITETYPIIRWHSEYIVAFLGIGGLAAYGIYQKWFKK